MSLVVAHSIAPVSTIARGGVASAAPDSFFDLFSEASALVVLGLEREPSGALEDTAQRIRDTGAFVVNLVDEAIADEMTLRAADVPAQASEPALAGLSRSRRRSSKRRGSPRRRRASNAAATSASRLATAASSSSARSWRCTPATA